MNISPRFSSTFLLRTSHPIKPLEFEALDQLSPDVTRKSWDYKASWSTTHHNVYEIHTKSDEQNNKVIQWLNKLGIGILMFYPKGATLTGSHIENFIQQNAWMKNAN